MELDDPDDPLNWSVEQVVAALCDRSNPCLQINANSVVPDLDTLAKGLRENLINGFTLLTTVNDNVLREDLGLRALGHRAFVSRAIRALRNKSIKFREQELEMDMQTPAPGLRGGVGDTTRSPTYSGFSSFSPEATPSHPLPYERHSTPRQILGQVPEENLSQLRFQGSTGFAPPEFSRLNFSNTRRGPMTDNQGISAIHRQNLEASPIQPERATVFGDVNCREKVTPSLTSKDAVPLGQRPPPDPTPTTGKVTIDGKERKRLAPTLVVRTPMASRGDERSPLGQAELRDPPDVSECIQTSFASQGHAGEVREFPNPYLGIKKIPAGDFFFGDARIGQELQGDAEDEDNFIITSVGRVSNGYRLYVNGLMRHYLFKPIQTTFSRNGKICHAIQPYSAKILQMLPNQTQSFILLSPSDRAIRVTREDISHWPDISTDGTFIEKPSAEANSTAQNDLALSQEDDSNHEWDFLLKWQHTGSDIIPAKLGESGSEGEYDLDTWNEIEQEHGPLDGTSRVAGKRTLQEDEVNRAIDDGINELTVRWEQEKLPKRERKSWSTWKKSRREGTKRFQIREAQHRIDQINEVRLSRMRREIVTERWTKAAAVRKQCRIMEQSIFDREDLKWMISLLERKREPPRPPPGPRKEKGPKVTGQLYSDEDEDVEVLGSGTDDFESGRDDGLGDFIIDDNAQGRENVGAVDTEMADVEDAEVESADEELTPRQRHKSSAGGSFDDLILGMDGDGDTAMSELPTASENVASILMTAASSPLSSARTLTTPNVSLPNTPTRNTSTRVLRHTSPRIQRSAFIDLTLSDPAEPPNPFRDGKKAPGHGRDTSKVPDSTARENKAISTKNKVIDLAASSDDDLQYDPLKGPSVETFEKTGDRKRLIIFIVGGGMSDHKRRLLGMRLAKQTRGGLRDDCIAGLDALSRGFETAFVQANDDNRTAMRLTRLFLCWIQCKRQPWDEKPSVELLNLARSKKEFFTFRRFLREVLRQYEADLFENIPINYNTDTEMRQNRDKPPSPKKTKKVGPERVNVVTHGYDTDPIGELQSPSSHSKRKRPVFENMSARNTRENDRQRLLDQEKRHAQLEQRLAKMGTTSAGDPSHIIVNTGKFEDQELIFLNEHIGKMIKPHQIQGVQFMWRELVTDEKSRQGCLLAHTMGLGKTMQVITLLVTIAEAAKSADSNISNQIPVNLRQSRSLVLCPPSLIDNWWDELLMWAPRPTEDNVGQLRRVDSSMTNLARRLSEISAWYDGGGILIMSYDIFRNYVLNKVPKGRPPPLSMEQHKVLKKELLYGPNIIVADEAHRLKNTATAIAVAAAQLRSKSRIALTGSPLANNLEEYHSMIDWIAPGYLGPLVEFRARYVEPIQDGLYYDSSLPEQRQCLKKLRVLKYDLDPKVSRADISVLKGSLPPKIEFVIRVSLTKVQEDAYKRYVQSMLSGSSGEVGNACLWDWLAILSLLCNHPLCFKNKLLERDRKDILQGNPAPASTGTSDEDIIDLVEDGQVEPAPGDAPVSKVGMTPAIIRQQIAALDRVGSKLDSIVHSHRAIVFDEILDASVKAGDKVLVFSHSIPTLDYLEGLLISSNRRYSRLDGNTKMSDRQKATKAFNVGHEDVYLVSARAGGVGLNLYGANRVVIFDFNFNPTWEEQAVGRAYRIGQKKPVYVYHFISAGTYEEVIHNKAVFKMQLASRVVDKKNPTRYAIKKNHDYLFEPKAVDRKDLSEFKGKDPNVLDKVIAAHEEDNCVVSIELTETFQQDGDDKLTAEEEREADQLLRDEQLKRADPDAYNKMVIERQKAAVAKAHTKRAQIGSHPTPSPLPQPLSTTSPRNITSTTTKGAEPSTSSTAKITPELERHSSSRLHASANLEPPKTEWPPSLTRLGAGSDPTADEHPESPEIDSGKAPDQTCTISPFISAFLEDEKRRDAGCS